MPSLLLRNRTWKGILIGMMFLSATVAAVVLTERETPVLPDEMLLPLLERESPPSTTQALTRAFSEAWTLSEDYLIATEAGELTRIEGEFDRRIWTIDEELRRLASDEDPGLKIVVANLQRLNNDFRRDAKQTFRLRRLSLGLEG